MYLDTIRLKDMGDDIAFIARGRNNEIWKEKREYSHPPPLGQ